MASLHLATLGFRAQSQNADACASNSCVEQSCKNTILKIQFQGGRFGRAIRHCFHVTGCKLFVDGRFFLSFNCWDCMLASIAAGLPCVV